MIDWESSENHFLLNPRLPSEMRELMQTVIGLTGDLSGQIWLMTSGSTSSTIPKWVALSKNAILVSAKAVNAHLQSDASDIWMNPLPDFHVGGLGISARAHLSGAQVFDFSKISNKWDSMLFYLALCHHKATLSALVPTQVFDLVASKLEAPPSLRAVIVGGGALQESLYYKALRLGWKLLPSYGLTECSSQVATASLDRFCFPYLTILGHVSVSVDDDGLLKLKSPSLLTTTAVRLPNGWKLIDPKINGWYTTEDRGAFKDGFLEIFGRGSSFIKIGGESTSLYRLEAILEEIKLDLDHQTDLALMALPDERLGYVIHLIAACHEMNKIQPVIDKFHAAVLPFERIRQIHLIKEIPRSPLKKLLKEDLIKLIS